MVDNFKDALSSGLGMSVYERVKAALNKYTSTKAEEGILIGLSGGADSVMLSLILSVYRELELPELPLLAVHVNHMIRGDEADRDEEFSRSLSSKLGIEFRSVRIDVPKLASELGCGIEEAARKARYSAFDEIIRGREDIRYIAVAHNSTDNLETVLFNLCRGSGLRGVSGIPPARDNIIRPLLSVSKSEITSTLDSLGIEYVTDSTNLSSDYTRNYIRGRILPKLSRLSPDPEGAVYKTSELLRRDLDFIAGLADEHISSMEGAPTTGSVSALHPSVASRVILRLCESVGCYGLEYNHVSKILELCSKDNFSYSLPNGFTFRAEYGRLSVSQVSEAHELSRSLKDGFNDFPELGFAIYLADRNIANISSNVYKYSKNASLSSAIIYGGLSVRSRKDGDSYYFGGHTHKVKKLFNDKKIPPSKRALIPIIEDEKGILIIPGFSARDDKGMGDRRIIFLYSEKSVLYNLFNN